MPKCALNKDTDDPSDWKGTDDDVWYLRWRIYVKGWFAFANRCPKGITFTIVFFPGLYLLPLIFFTGWSWWYLFPVGILPVARKWRLMPIILFAIKGKGMWRMENTDSSCIVPTETYRLKDHYFSRIQRWCRWHLALHWPFLITGHFYFNQAYVPSFGHEHDTDGQLINFYRGWHRDEDEIYWGDGGFVGMCFK